MYINKEECKLIQLLSRLHLQFEKQLAERDAKGLNINLYTGIQDENFTILTDEIRLFQVLENLIENALSFADEGSIEYPLKIKVKSKFSISK